MKSKDSDLCKSNKSLGCLRKQQLKELLNMSQYTHSTNNEQEIVLITERQKSYRHSKGSIKKSKAKVTQANQI